MDSTVVSLATWSRLKRCVSSALWREVLRWYGWVAPVFRFVSHEPAVCDTMRHMSAWAQGTYEFVNAIIGNAIPPEYINAVKKGFEEALEKGPQIGHKVQGVKVVLTDGQAHMVDSSELAFKLAAQYAFREVLPDAGATILEPLMKVEVEVPEEFQSTVIGLLNQRKGQLQNSETRDGSTVIEAHVPLSSMFGFSTALRSGTQGKGEFTMEYHSHSPVMRDFADQLRKEYQASLPGAK